MGAGWCCLAQFESGVSSRSVDGPAVSEKGGEVEKEATVMVANHTSDHMECVCVCVCGS